MNYFLLRGKQFILFSVEGASPFRNYCSSRESMFANAVEQAKKGSIIEMALGALKSMEKIE